jgi:hypothetical protein
MKKPPKKPDPPEDFPFQNTLRRYQNDEMTEFERKRFERLMENAIRCYEQDKEPN